MLRLRPEMAADGIKLGDKVKNEVLHARYSRTCSRWPRWIPPWVAELAEVGGRFTHHSKHSADRNHFPVAGQQRQQRHRAELRPPLQPQRHRSRAEEQRAWTFSLRRGAARLSRAGEPGAMPYGEGMRGAGCRITSSPPTTHQPDRARGHPGRPQRWD